jgi:hypothetical protein
VIALYHLKDAETYIPADPALCDAFNNGTGPGPTYVPVEPGSPEMAIKLDFRAGVSFEKGWNLACAEMVTDHLMAGINLLRGKMPFPLPANPRAYFLSATQAKLRSYFRYYKFPATQMEKNPGATDAEIALSVTQTHRSRNEAVKRTNRRESVFAMLLRASLSSPL